MPAYTLEQRKAMAERRLKRQAAANKPSAPAPAPVVEVVPEPVVEVAPVEKKEESFFSRLAKAKKSSSSSKKSSSKKKKN